VKQSRKLEIGSSLAWAAFFLATLILPLMLLVVDGSRLLDIRGRLQTATDAACEDAAWLVGDRAEYLASGQSLFGDLQVAYVQAQHTFTATLGERNRMVFSAAFSLTFDESNNQVLCSAEANVPILFDALGNAPAVSIPARAVAATRFR
jgi:hypothetical protein